MVFQEMEHGTVTECEEYATKAQNLEHRILGQVNKNNTVENSVKS